jgi:hypothetical protein
VTNEELCQSISNVINGYRNKEFGEYDYNHVNRWVSQFEDCEKRVVLEETNRILKKNFISHDLFLKFIDALIQSPSIYVEEKDSYWNKVSLLDIQKNGNSQKELNTILHGKLNELYDVPNIIGKESEEYIYLDDFIFSGNRLFADMDLWLRNNSLSKARVCVITIGWYAYGQYKTEKRLKDLAKSLGKEIDFVFTSFNEYRLENRLYRKNYSTVFWPTSTIQELPEAVTFLQEQNYTFPYRTPVGMENAVFSRSRREEYEKIMVKYGLKILSFSAQNNVVVKPLGYDVFRGLGFGSTIFSFRNCPNNNPLAFWWGDPKASPFHPFSKWYPLMQRKTYG